MSEYDEKLITIANFDLRLSAISMALCMAFFTLFALLTNMGAYHRLLVTANIAVGSVCLMILILADKYKKNHQRIGL
jgi:hypothetical protein